MAAGGFLWLRSANGPQVDGTLKLAGLSAPVNVLRDELGVPYLFAANTPDLIRAQGFVTAQHRLMQMELFRATWRGELAATFGRGDAAQRHPHARARHPPQRRHATRRSSSPESRAFLQHYVDGVNAYVARPRCRPSARAEGSSGLAPRAWSVADLVTLVHFIHYTHATNFKAEVVAQKLIDQLGLRACARRSSR